MAIIFNGRSIGLGRFRVADAAPATVPGGGDNGGGDNGGGGNTGGGSSGNNRSDFGYLDRIGNRIVDNDDLVRHIFPVGSVLATAMYDPDFDEVYTYAPIKVTSTLTIYELRTHFVPGNAGMSLRLVSEYQPDVILSPGNLRMTAINDVLRVMIVYRLHGDSRNYLAEQLFENTNSGIVTTIDYDGAAEEMATEASPYTGPGPVESFTGTRNIDGSQPIDNYTISPSTALLVRIFNDSQDESQFTDYTYPVTLTVNQLFAQMASDTAGIADFKIIAHPIIPGKMIVSGEFLNGVGGQILYTNDAPFYSSRIFEMFYEGYAQGA